MSDSKRSYHDGATGAAVWFVKLLHGHPEDPPQMGCKPEAIAEKLEELLREAHIEGHGCRSTLEAKEGRIQKVYSCGEHEPIGLEKARAIEGKG